MYGYQEKRSHERFEQKAPVHVAHFHSNHMHQATKCNHGEGGVCLSTDRPFNPGAVVFIRSDQCTSEDLSQDACAGLRTITLDEVRWCLPLADDYDSSFSVGVKYLEPAY